MADDPPGQIDPHDKEHKSALRRRMLARRQRLDPGALPAARAAVCDVLQRWEVSAQASRLAGFVAVRNEMSVAPFLQWALGRGRQVYLPRVTGPGQMVMARLERWEALVEEGAFGIPAPPPCDDVLEGPDGLELILVPGVAFDRRGGRLGMGGGYYDRFLGNGLEKIGAAGEGGQERVPGRRCWLVGIGYDWQLVEAPLPMERHDVRLDAVATESGLYLRDTSA